MEFDLIKVVEKSISMKRLSVITDVPSQPCIFEVPECLRKVKKECYTPSLFSIGPIHFNKHPSLAAAEEMKLRHLALFLSNARNEHSLQEYIKMIGDMEGDIRGCYAEKISISSPQLVELALVDAVFLICCIMRIEGSYIVGYTWLLSFFTRDLFLLENQLPFFVLEALYDKAFSSQAFIDLACNFMDSLGVPGAGSLDIPETKQRIKAANIKHFVDLLWICWLPSFLRDEHVIGKDNDKLNILSLHILLRKTLEWIEATNLKPFVDLLRICWLRDKQIIVEDDVKFCSSVTNLKAAGVTFKASESKNLRDISFKDNGVLEIPKLYLAEDAESILRNLLYYEQCLHLNDSYIMHYFTLLNKLIDTPEDVQILVKSGIIDHDLGDNVTVSQLFNNITYNLTFNVNQSYYSKIYTELNAFTEKRHHRWMAVLRRDYFNHPWAIISVIYLVLLLILTVLQVISGFK